MRNRDIAKPNLYGKGPSIFAYISALSLSKKETSLNHLLSNRRNIRPRGYGTLGCCIKNVQWHKQCHFLFI